MKLKKIFLKNNKFDKHSPRLREKKEDSNK